MGGPPKANQARDVVRQRLSPDGARLLQLNDLQRTLRARSASVDRAKPAIRRHFKTGHFR
jgi:hypothetical protein